MYFVATVGGSSHLWRQRFPDKTPEQITFGPTEEEGIALAPDGGSLVTSVGMRHGAIWMHDAAGERPISSEGYASAPRLSRDGKHLFYLLQWDSDSITSSGELRDVDLASGKSGSLLPGLSVKDYDISPDEREVAFTTTQSDGESQIWLASLDRRSAPSQVARGGDEASFGAHGELLFRMLEKNLNFLGRVNRDGSGLERILNTPILNKLSVSPDGEWIIVFAPLAGEKAASEAATPETVAVPVRGGARQKICSGRCPPIWSSDGRFLYVENPPGKTLAIPVPAGRALPDLPAPGVGLVALPGARVIEQGNLFPGPDPATYVFQRTELRHNLFRIPLH